ncbi:MAG: Valine--tRNA ligase, mitochondrial [Candelina mexicana]|nr:MAG: Valine--tRNA ligase, mitochondrial [Candelina mexicana]
MALNAASHNPMGEKTGPVTGAPPPLSDEVKNAIGGSATSDPIGQHEGGHDGGDKDEGKKVKSEKELEKERKKAEKAKKFAEKQNKTLNAAPSAAAKSKEKKAKAEAAKEEPLPEYVEETPSGQKKILKPLDDAFHKAYIPGVVESAWYSWWEKEGFFEPEFGKDGNVKKEGYFVIPEPPPNVTGALHMGHALPNALQDTLIRWNRMLGKTTVWVPGCDHAGISTQSVVENMLWRRQKKTRYDLGRPKFTELIWDWKEEYHSKINSVLKRMGGSFDWTREAFTMDENLSAAVTETFVRLHEEGIIYRANRLIHWCVKLNTAVSNLEVDNKELEGRTLLDVPGYERKVEFGVLTHFKYEIDGSDETIEVATTRPETMLGDTGIAVSPKDERYKHLVGKNARHPFVNRLLPIFTDDHVDPEFGTGAVKITPAHDANDFAIGSRHNLNFINILNDDGTMNGNTGKFEGTKRFDARYSVVEELKAKGLYVKKEDNPMKVPLCAKSKDVIEPIMKPQWWMRMRELADDAIRVVKDGEITIRPDSAEKSYFRWLETINDWCLSRQLWWGHQAPAYFIELEGEKGDDSDGNLWVTGRTVEDAEKKAREKFPGKKYELIRDPDVLDTWFSSGLWPFSTLGWPKQTHDLATLYPTSILETGWDILFFWVARMIMLGIKLTGQVPFREVYCHSLVRDSEGRKMSKSLGNVIDPLDIMQGISLQALHDKLKIGNLDPKELATATKFQKASFPDGIPECGADALRFSLISYTTGGGDIAFDIKVMHGYRRFCNKIYQATKFVLGKLEADFVPQKTGSKTGKESLAERWILHKLTVASREINQALADREFSQATNITYQYWYNHLCDVYIENSKSIIQDGTPEEQRSAKDTLYTALEGALTMIHPFMPFLTEELWQRLPRRPNDSTPSIVKAAYPVYQQDLDDPSSEAAYELLLGVSKGIRSLMSEYSIKDEGKVFVQTSNSTAYQTANSELQSIKSLSGKGVSSLEILTKEQAKPTGCVVFVVSSDAAVYLHVKGRVDIDAEISKAMGKLKKASDGAARQRKILDDPSYREKVKEELQETERKKLRDFEAEGRSYEESIQQFETLKLE